MTTVICMRDKKAVAEAKAAGLFVYVGREPYRVGPWGNRYSHQRSTIPGVIRVATRKEAVELHREYTLSDVEKVGRIKAELKDKVLGCWCGPGLGCHAQTYAAIADGTLK